MFDLFTDRAKKVIALSREEAMRHRHDIICPEHMLLGLAAEGTGVAATVLRNQKVNLDDVRRSTVHAMTPGMSTAGQLPFRPSAKRVLESSLEASSECGHNYIGTEHLLLGLLRVNGTIAADVLAHLGIELDQTRADVVEFCGEQGSADRSKHSPSDIPSLRRRALLKMQGLRSPILDGTAIVMLPSGEPSQKLCLQIIEPALQAAGATRVQLSNGEKPDDDIRYQLGRHALLLAVLPSLDPWVLYQIGIGHGMGRDVVLLVDQAIALPDHLLAHQHISFDFRNADHAKLHGQIATVARAAFGSNPPT